MMEYNAVQNLFNPAFFVTTNSFLNILVNVRSTQPWLIHTHTHERTHVEAFYAIIRGHKFFSTFFGLVSSIVVVHCVHC